MALFASEYALPPALQEGAHRRKVDDASGLPLDHVRDDRGRAQAGSFDRDVVDPIEVPGVGEGVMGRHTAGNPRVVDEDIDLPEGPDGACRHGFDCGLVGDIGADGQRPASMTLDVPGGRLEEAIVRLDVCNHYIRPGLREGECNSAAETAPRSRHERDPTLLGKRWQRHL